MQLNALKIQYSSFELLLLIFLSIKASDGIVIVQFIKNKEMIKLKCGNVTRLFLCVYLEIMNIQVDELQLKPFRKSSMFIYAA